MRWAPPQEPAKWEGVRQCFKYLAAPVQPGPEENPREDDVYAKEWSVDTSLQLNEDCLYLNIWTPAKKTDEKLPVYFWIYGGGWQVGHASEMEFDGERIARRGIVVVTINYRVNLFGFTCHPEITAEYPEAPANFGLLDQHKALTWVYKNISNFGGDPEQITIGGQSAGGGSVINQLAYKKNKPMIKRAVVESGMFINPFMTMFPSRSLADAEKIGQEFFEFCGVKNLKEARELSTEFLFKKWDEWGGFPKSAMTWGPVMWVMLGEMFNNRIRAVAIAVCGLAQWLANFLVTFTFPILSGSVGPGFTYALYTFFAFTSIFFVLKFIKETKQKSLEEM